LRKSAAIILALLGLTLGPGRADELTDIRAVRSFAAEAAKVIEFSNQHKVTATYTAVMKNQARSQLRNTAESTDSPRVKKYAQQAIDAVNANDPATLKRIAQELFTMEGVHGRAD